MKKRLWRAANWSGVTDKRPVVLSGVAPVAAVYALKASVASRSRVVPVSTIPAVDGRIVVSPYATV